MNEFVMNARQAALLDSAFVRTGWTSEDVEKLSGGNVAAEVLKYLRGEAVLSPPVVHPRPQMILSDTFDASKAFEDRPGLQVDSYFRTRIMAEYLKPIGRQTLLWVKSFDFVRNQQITSNAAGRYHRDIHPHRYACTPDQVEEMILSQQNGEVGHLLPGESNNAWVILPSGDKFEIVISWVGDHWRITSYDPANARYRGGACRMILNLAGLKQIPVFE